MRHEPVSRWPLRFGVALSALASSLPATASQPVLGAESPAAPLYRLIDSVPPAFTGWHGPALAAPLLSTVGLAPRHELRLSASLAAGSDYARTLGGVSFATLAGAPTMRLDAYRATYRYTFFEQTHWQWKIGITASLQAFDDTWRGGLTRGQRLRLGTAAQVHFAGEGRLTDKWRLAFDADSPTTLRGRAFDLGLRVSYSLSPNVLLYGGYRIGDGTPDGEEFHGLTNSANVGLRLRF